MEELLEPALLLDLDPDPDLDLDLPLPRPPPLPPPFDSTAEMQQHVIHLTMSQLKNLILYFQVFKDLTMK